MIPIKEKIKKLDDWEDWASVGKKSKVRAQLINSKSERTRERIQKD